MRVTCPECGKEGKAPDESEGKRIRCPKCGVQFRAGGEPARGGVSRTVIVAVCVASGVVLLLCVIGLFVGLSRRPPERVMPAEDPAAVTANRLDGWTASDWALQAESPDLDRHARSCAALAKMGEEGIPFLVATLRKDATRFGLDDDRTNSALKALVGARLAPDDLLFVAEHMAAPPDPARASAAGCPRRIYAADVLASAGALAKPCLPYLRRVRAEPNLPKPLTEALDRAVAKVGG
jgi:hypothetical protein